MVFLKQFWDFFSSILSDKSRNVRSKRRDAEEVSSRAAEANWLKYQREVRQGDVDYLCYFVMLYIHILRKELGHLLDILYHYSIQVRNQIQATKLTSSYLLHLF